MMDLFTRKDAQQLKTETGESAYNCMKALLRCELDLARAKKFLEVHTWDSHGFLVDKTKVQHGSY